MPGGQWVYAPPNQGYNPPVNMYAAQPVGQYGAPTQGSPYNTIPAAPQYGAAQPYGAPQVPYGQPPH